MTKGLRIGVLNESARPGDTVIAAAGGPPGDLLKIWDASNDRRCHLEFRVLVHGLRAPRRTRRSPRPNPTVRCAFLSATAAT